MFASCACPLPTEITDIPAEVCAENIGQIQRIIFQRKQATGSPTFATQVLPKTLANWTTLLTATDSTKVQATPLFQAHVIPQVTAITEGGDDNSTIDGNQNVVGASTIEVTGEFPNLPAAILAALQLYNCEPNLTVFFVNEYKKILGWSTTLVSTDFRGIDIKEFFIGDGGSEGKNTTDKTMFRYNMKYGWRSRLRFVTPTDFDPLFDI